MGRPQLVVAYSWPVCNGILSLDYQTAAYRYVLAAITPVLSS
jgi:hypothetical protein